MAETVFLDYDQDALDAQLNLRARWPEYTEHFSRWARESAALRETRSGQLDLAYGVSASETLDLFVPETKDPPPLHAFIHGGYWQILDKSDFSYLAEPYLEAGSAFASLNYDLAPKVGVDEIVRQMQRAFAWLYREGAGLGIDPDRIYVSGHSAGGHLAAMVLATDWVARDLPADLIKGGCSVSGVYDLDPVRRSYHQAVLALDEATVAEMSPVTSLPRGQAPVILALGSEETEEFHRQQRAYAKGCRASDIPLQVVDLPARNHFTAIDALGETDHPLYAAMLSLLRA